MRWTLLLLSSLLGGCAGPDLTLQEQRITTMSDTLAAAAERHPEILTVAVTPAQSDNPALSNWFARELEEKLVTRSSFFVLERSDFEAILTEHRLVLSDVFDETRRPELGRLVGADALVITEIRPNPEKSFYVLRCRLIVMETGRILASEGNSLSADDLEFDRPPVSDEKSSGFFGIAGNVVITVGKIPLTPVTMVFDIFETVCIDERGKESRLSYTYPERVLKGIWDGVPIPLCWVWGTTGNDLYLTRGMWNAWF